MSSTICTLLVLLRLTTANRLIPADSSSLNECQQKMVDEYFGEDNDLLIAIDDAASSTDFRLTTPHWLLNAASATSLPQPKRIDYKNYLLKSANLSSARRTIERLIDAKWLHKTQSASKTFLLLLDDESSAAHVFGELYGKRIRNAIVGLRANDTYESYVSEGGECGQPAVVDRCGDCNSLRPHAFRRYPRDLTGCRLVFRMAIGLITESLQFYEGDKAKGLFVEPLRILNETYRVDLSFVRMHVNLTQLDVSASQKLARCNANEMVTMAIGIRRDVSCERSHWSYAIKKCWVLRKPEKLTHARTFWSIFRRGAFLYAIAGCAIFSVILWLSVNSRRDENLQFAVALLDAIQLGLGKSIVFRTRNVAIRSLTIAYICYAFYMNSAFVAGLLSVMTRPNHEPPIDSDTELADSNKIPVVSMQYHKEMLTLGYDSIALKLHSKTTIITEAIDNSFTFLMENKQFALLLNCPIVWALPDAQKNELNYFESSSTNMINLAAYDIEEGHPALATIEHVLQVVRENCLYKKWLSDYGKITFYNKGEDDFVVIRMEHILPTLQLLIAGLGFGSMLFIGEIIYCYYTNKN